MSQDGAAGGPIPFPTTVWSQFLQARHPDPGVRRASLEFLARTYWRPVYAYIRHRGPRPEEEALDLTQDFFVWMLETDFLGRADPSRGRFRAFVKVVLKNFLSNEIRHRTRQKRGGGRPPLSIELSREEAGGLAISGAPTPEEALDEEWRRELFARAMERLRKLYAAEGNEICFRLFEEYYVGGGEPDYRAMAERHGLSAARVANLFQQAKQRLRRVVHDLAAETVETREELDEEIRFLLGGA